ncbi:MAG: hypothetical protein JWO94_3792, partial [Verrucomicrobiaceae bacterium]|nr:hypothetical protein [Verrucomicrobiaceae bacterium]
MPDCLSVSVFSRAAVLLLLSLAPASRPAWAQQEEAFRQWTST